MRTLLEAGGQDIIWLVSLARKMYGRMKWIHTCFGWVSSCGCIFAACVYHHGAFGDPALLPLVHADAMREFGPSASSTHVVELCHPCVWRHFSHPVFVLLLVQSRHTTPAYPVTPLPKIEMPRRTKNKKNKTKSLLGTMGPDPGHRWKAASGLLVVAGSFSWMRWETISVLVPLIRVSKRLMNGWLINWLTFSVPHIQPRRNTLLKSGVDIVGKLNWCPTSRKRWARFLWSRTSVSPTTVSEVALTLVLTDT
jgi:hypothetical protein